MSSFLWRDERECTHEIQDSYEQSSRKMGKELYRQLTEKEGEIAEILEAMLVLP